MKTVTGCLVFALAVRFAAAQPLELIDQKILGHVLASESPYGVTVRTIIPSPDNTRFKVRYRFPQNTGRESETRILDLRTLESSGKIDQVVLEGSTLRWRGSESLENWASGELYNLANEGGGVIREENEKKLEPEASIVFSPNAEAFGLRVPGERMPRSSKSFSDLKLYDGDGRRITTWEGDSTAVGLAAEIDGRIALILPGAYDNATGQRQVFSPREFIDVKTGTTFTYSHTSGELDSLITDLDFDAVLNRLAIWHGNAFSVYYLDDGRMFSFPDSVGLNDENLVQEYRSAYPILGRPYYVMLSRTLVRNPSTEGRHEQPFFITGLSIDIVSEEMKAVQSIEPFVGIGSGEQFSEYIEPVLNQRSDCEVKVCVSEKFVTLITFGIDKEGRLVKGLKVFRPNASVQ